MNNSRTNMTEGKIFPSLISFAIPVMLTGVLQLLFNAADLVVVGRFCGSDCVGAVGATTTLINLMLSFSMGLSSGAGVVVAHRIGAKDDAGTEKAAHTAILLGLICGVVLSAVGICFADTFLSWMGTPAEIIDRSVLYLRIYFCGTVANMVNIFGSAVLRAVGDTKRPLVYLVIAGIANVGLNLLFVLAFDMTVDGVAAATAISQVISAALVVAALLKRTDACRLCIRKIRFYKAELLNVLKVGVPAGIQSSLFHASNVIIQSSVNTFGAVAVSGNAAGANLEAFSLMAMNGFYQATLSFVGQNTGAKKYDRIGRVMLCCLASVAVTGIVIGNGEYIFGRQLLSLYLKDAGDAVEYGLLRLMYICVPHLLAGSMDVMSAGIRGMGKSTVPMVITVLGVCGLRIVWIYTVFAHYHTIPSLFISYPISWAITLAAETVAFFIIKRNLTAREKGRC